MLKRFGILIGGPLLLWVVLAVPARQVWGDPVLLMSAVAMGVCLLPALLTLAWSAGAGKTFEAQLFLILGGTVLRLGIVLAGGFALHLFFPRLFPPAFWIWLLIFYMFTLTLETVLLVKTGEKRL